MEICTVVTRDREEMVDITERLCAVIREKGWRHGVAALFCPHTTCGLTINEGADPDVRRDMTAFFSRIIPYRGEWRHGEGNSDAHIKASLMGPSLFVIVEDGEPRLGTWQSVYLYEGDGPRSRSIRMVPRQAFIPEARETACPFLLGELPDAARPAFPPCAGHSCGARARSAAFPHESS